MKKSSKKSRPFPPRPVAPVLAIRVPSALHQQIQEEAKRTGATMSETAAGLLARALEWHASFLTREQIISEARRILAETSADCRRIRTETLRVTLKQQNWRELENGHWLPPELHSIPHPDGFALGELLATEIEEEEQKRTKKAS